MEQQTVAAHEKVRAIGRLVLLFAVVNLVTAIFFTSGAGDPQTAKVPKTGGTVGPIEVEEADTVLDLEIRQPLGKDNVWSAIHGEVQNEKKEHLFAFGEELWREAGYDDGHWRETKDTFDLKVTLPEKGKYYLYFEAEASGSNVGGMIHVQHTRKVGSAVPHCAAGLVALVVGLVLLVVAVKMRANATDWSEAA